MEKREIIIHHPVQKNRFRIEFFRGKELIGPQKLLSINLVNFEFDEVSQEFTCVFQLPSGFERDLYNEICLIQEFYHHILNGDGESVFERKFEIKELSGLITKYDYASGDGVNVILKGLYKQ